MESSHVRISVLDVSHLQDIWLIILRITSHINYSELIERHSIWTVLSRLTSNIRNIYYSLLSICNYKMIFFYINPNRFQWTYFTIVDLLNKKKSCNMERVYCSHMLLFGQYVLITQSDIFNSNYLNFVTSLIVSVNIY